MPEITVSVSRVVAILEKLVAFDTTSRNANLECIEWIQAYLARHGVKADIIPGSEKGKACLFAAIGPQNEGGIVLAGHTDVVPVDDQKWQSDPFTLTEKDGKLFARGACDMKGFIACALAMVPELVKAKLERPVYLAFTHDEEEDMSGAANLTRFMKERGIKPEWVWVGEPTEHHIIDSHKGVAAFETTIKGVPAHSGKPALGLNAIELGHAFTGVLLEVLDEKRRAPFDPSRYDPPYTTINLGKVKGGTAENITAEHWEQLWQTRVHPGDDHDAMLAEIETRAQQRLRPRFEAFRAVDATVGCRTCVKFNIPPLLPSADNPGHKILGRLTGHNQTEAVSFATEAGFFQSLGAAVVVCGPGSIDQAHKADEFVKISQLADCVDLIRSVLLPSGPHLRELTP